MCPHAILHSISATIGKAAAIEGGASTRVRVVHLGRSTWHAISGRGN